MLPDKKRNVVSKYLVKKCKNGLVLVAIFLMVQLELNVDLKIYSYQGPTRKQM